MSAWTRRRPRKERDQLCDKGPNPRMHESVACGFAFTASENLTTTKAFPLLFSGRPAPNKAASFHHVFNLFTDKPEERAFRMDVTKMPIPPSGMGRGVIKQDQTSVAFGRKWNYGVWVGGWMGMLCLFYTMPVCAFQRDVRF